MPSRCADCVFYLAEGNQAYGICRRYPPTVLDANIDGIKSTWPKVDWDDTCGEWSDKEKT